MEVAELPVVDLCVFKVRLPVTHTQTQTHTERVAAVTSPTHYDAARLMKAPKVRDLAAGVTPIV